jgi:hypothetical protein
MDLEIGDAPSSANAPWDQRIAAARAAVPTVATWSGQAQRTGDKVDIVLHGADMPPVDGLDVLPVERKLLDYAPAQIEKNDDGLTIRAGVSDYYESAPPALTLVLLQRSGEISRAWQVRVPFVPAGDTHAARSTP